MLLTEMAEFLDNMGNQTNVKELENQHCPGSPPFQMRRMKQKFNNREMLMLSVLGKIL